MRTRVFKALILSCLLLVASCVDYSTQVQTALERVIGKEELQSYVFYGQPRSRFGVGTMFLSSALENGGSVDEWLLIEPETWWAPGVSEEQKRNLQTQIIAAGTLGSIELNETITSKIGLNAVAPVATYLTSLDASLEMERGVTVQISASKVSQRRLNWIPFMTALNAGQLNEQIRRYINLQNFTIVNQDFLIEGYTADVTVDQSVNPTLVAKLSELSAIPSTEVTFGVSRTVDGAFRLAAAEAVVAAVSLRKPPSGAVLSSRGPESWALVKPPASQLASIEVQMQEK